MVAKWNYCTGKVLDKISIHYNIGHLMTMHGDTKHPQGKYLVALNKLAIDRFNPVGPLHPQNHQLIDITGNKMVLLTDMPVPLGEPHYAVGINAKLLKPAVRYKSGWNSRTNKRSPYKTRAGREKTVRTAGKVEVFGTTIRSHITPEIIEVDEGDEVIIHLTNLERAEDETHGFALYGHNINLSLEPGKTSTFSFTADKAGVYPYYCTEFCSALHLEMEGYLLVKPKGFKDVATKAEAGATYTEADYDKQVKENVATQAVIDQVVGFITSHNYQDFQPVVDLVEDATDQLGFAKEAKAKSEAAAKKKDWLNAALWANQWWQYQVKAADIGLRAKTYLEQHGAKQVAPAAKAAPKAKAKPTNLKADYEKLEQANLAQLATLNQEFGAILIQNYYDFPAVATSVADALKQLNVSKKVENNAKAAAEKADWKNAISEANKWQETQNKATEITAQAKTALKQAGGKKVVGVPKKMISKAAPITEITAADVADGARLYKLKGCIACHGVDGRTARESIYPSIAGQGQAYIVAQMKYIKSGVRHNAKTAVMKGIMGAVNDAEIENLAQWLAGLPGNVGIKADASLAAKGAELYKSKDTNCIGCHGADANTPLRPDHFPKLAGQNKGYLINQITDIKRGARDDGMTTVMTGVMQGLNDKDIEALAEWLSSLKGPSAKVVVAKKEIPVKTEVPVAVTPEVVMKPSTDVVTMEGARLYKKEGCFACHGADAKTSLQPLAPKLAGQGQAYLVTQLKDMKSGARHNETTVMKAIMETVSEAEIEPIAEWLSTLPGGTGVIGNAALTAKGAEIYKSKETNCAGCHGADANTPLRPDNFPKLAGQNKQYLITQIKDIRDGVRNNGDTIVMAGITKGMNDEDIEAVAEWLASLNGPAATSEVVPSVVKPVEKPAPVVVEPVTMSKPERKIVVEKAVPAVVTKPTKAIVSNGATLYNQKGCIACHGVDGKMPIMPNYPKIAGLPQAYAIAMMKDIKTGARHNGQTMVMKGLMSSVSDAEMASIAEWLATLASGAGIQGNATLMAKGKALYKSKTCIACHGVDGKKPVLPTYPKLAGQNKQYAIVQITDIKTGARDNGQTAAMKGVMHLVSNEEIGAIAEWLTSLDGESSVPVAETKPEPVVVTKTTSHGSSVGTWNQSGGEKDEAMHLKPNLENGLEVFEVCSACHLPEGWGAKEGTFPQLAGQHRTVLIKQLADIRAKNRDNPTMYPFALPSEIGGPQALADVTGYIAKLPMNPENGVGAGDDLELGKQLFKDNCVKCHGEKGEGKPEKFYPRIQGQHYKYMLRQFEWIRDGKRRNANPDMVKQIKGFTDKDMKAVIDYVSRVKPPKEDLGEPGWLNPDFD
jgi:nitrous-oxide reductase